MLKMLGILGGFGPTVLGPNNLIDERMLGKDGFEALVNPDRAAVQRIYPVLKKGTKTERIGSYFVQTVGPRVELPQSMAMSISEALRKPLRANLTSCVIHPDHVIRFAKGTSVVEFITCFSCRHLIVVSNGKSIAAGALPTNSKLSDMRALISLDDDKRARIDEHLGERAYDVLLEAKMATAYVVSFPNAVFGPQSAKILSKPVAVTHSEVAELRTLFVSSQYFDRNRASMWSEPPQLVSSAILIVLPGEPRIEFLFNSLSVGSSVFRRDENLVSTIPVYVVESMKPILERIRVEANGGV